MKKLLLVLIVLSFACKKKKQASVSQHPVPSVAVQINMYPNDPLNFNLKAIGGWMYVSGGINGLVVYRKSEEEFVAIERTSPQSPDNPAAKVMVLNDNFT